MINILTLCILKWKIILSEWSRELKLMGSFQVLNCKMHHNKIIDSFKGKSFDRVNRDYFYLFKRPQEDLAFHANHLWLISSPSCVNEIK